jgi:ATP-dependent RNA helicase RhlE
VTVSDFDYDAKTQAKLEVPLAQRIAEIRARKRDERARAAVNAARRSASQRGQAPPRPADGNRDAPRRDGAAPSYGRPSHQGRSYGGPPRRGPGGGRPPR